jgi:hypothetical protein
VSEVWIEIVCSNGDQTEVPDDWEGAVAAARQMERDHFDACPCIGRGRDLTFAFLVDGKHVRTVDAKALDS